MRRSSTTRKRKRKPSPLSRTRKKRPQTDHPKRKSKLPRNRRTKPGVLVQPELEKRRSPLVSIPPFGRGFSRHRVFRSDGGWAAQERVLTSPFIVSMSPPGYPSAWLRPRSARFRFARQVHCSSAAPCCSQFPACRNHVQSDINQ